MNSLFLAPLLGILAALAWGGSDFSGGLSTKRSSVWWVVVCSQAVGALLLAVLGLAFGESWPGNRVLLIGALSGIIGEIGLLLLYQGLAVGRMGVVAPLSAVLSALVPAGFGFILEGLPRPFQLAGIGLAVPAVWLVSAGSLHGRAQKRELLLGLGAGVAFGGFFILIDQVSSQAVFWPLFVARLASISLLGLILLLLRPSPRPSWQSLPLIAAAGVLDSSGNLFFALATRVGRLDLAAVLGSLYPAVTILLAYLLLRERLARTQWIGVSLAMVVVVLISGCSASPAPRALQTEAAVVTPRPAEATPGPAVVTNASPTAAPPSSTPVLVARLPASQVSFSILKLFPDQGGWAVATIDDRGDAILHSQDGGRSWQVVTPPEASTPGQATAFFLDSQQAWASIYPSNTGSDQPTRVWASQDGGQSWQASQPLVPGGLEDTFGGKQLIFLDPSNGWLVLQHGAAAGSAPISLYRTDDGGLNWRRILDVMSERSGSINTCCQSGLLMVDETNGLITTSLGPDPFLHVNWTRDGGSAWERQNLPLPSGVPEVSDCGSSSPVLSFDGQVALLAECPFTEPAGLGSAYLYTTPDLGGSWTYQRLPDPPAEAGWEYTWRERSLQYGSDGLAWLFIKDRYESADGSKVKTLVTPFTSPDGQNWQPLPPLENAAGFNLLPDGQIWAFRNAETGASLLFSRDSGQNWQTIQPDFFKTQP